MPLITGKTEYAWITLFRILRGAQYVFSVWLSDSVFEHHGVSDLFNERVATLLASGG